MYDFCFHVPTKVYFGKEQLAHLSELAESGSKVLLVYGGGSIKRTGLYDKVAEALHEAGLETFDLGGVEPNPRIQTVRKGTQLCKENGIDMVLAVGGGSSIDCAKVVAAAAVYDGDAWDVVADPFKIAGALPIYTVLTMAATGSEMDPVAVISDKEKNLKPTTFSPFIQPTMSILDPELTYTVPARQTAAGTADIMSHTMENYFTSMPGCDVQQGFAEVLLRTCVKYGPVALATPDDYDARANLMWAASHAINGLIAAGAANNWCVHPMEHELSAYYDVTHGEGLAVLTPAWMRHVLSDETEGMFARFARNVFGIDAAMQEADRPVAEKGIDALQGFFTKTLGIPATMRELGIESKDDFAAMAKSAALGCKGCYVPLSEEDIVAIYEAAF